MVLRPGIVPAGTYGSKPIVKDLRCEPSVKQLGSSIQLCLGLLLITQ